MSILPVHPVQRAEVLRSARAHLIWQPTPANSITRRGDRIAAARALLNAQYLAVDVAEAHARLDQAGVSWPD